MKGLKGLGMKKNKITLFPLIIAVLMAEATLAFAQAPLGRFKDYAIDGSTVTVRGETGRVELTAYNNAIVKVLSLPNGTQRQERRTVSVAMEPLGEFTVSADNDTLLCLSKEEQGVCAHGDVVETLIHENTLGSMDR